MALGSDPVSAGSDHGAVRTSMEHLNLHASGLNAMVRIDVALAVSFCSNALMVQGCVKH